MYEDVVLSMSYFQLNVKGCGGLYVSVDFRVLLWSKRCTTRRKCKFHNMSGGVRLRPRPGACTDTGTATRVRVQRKVLVSDGERTQGRSENF